MRSHGRTSYRKQVGNSLVLGLLSLVAAAQQLSASPFEISYSGRLVDELSRPKTSSLDLSIRFFDAASAGNQKGGALSFANVQPNEAGIFTVSLTIPSTEFTAVLGDDRGTWIEVTDLNANKTYPRQRLSATPYALRVPYDPQSLTYNNQGQLKVNQVEQSQVVGLNARLGEFASSGHTHNLGGDLSGDLSAAKIEKLRGHNVSPTDPSQGQYLQWNGTAWTPASATGDFASDINLFGQKELRFSEASPAEGINYVALKAPALIANNLTLTLPATAGISGQVLATDGTGQLSWIPVANDSLSSLSARPPLAAPAGSTREISIAQANGVADGYLAKEDWLEFNSKQAAGNYISALSGDGTLNGFAAGSANLSLKNTGSSGTYTKVTTDAQGRVTFGASLLEADIPMLSAAKIGSGNLSVAQGGTGTGALASNSVLLGNDTAAVQAVAPGAPGNVLMSDGSTWTSAALSSEIADGTIHDADISETAAIADIKLATISSPGKVSGTAITSGNINTSGNIVSTGSIKAGSNGFIFPDGSIQTTAAVENAVRTKTEASTIAVSDSIIIADATTTAFNLTLPSAIGIAGRQYIVKKRDSSANAVTVTTSSSQTIDGAASFILGSQWVFVTVISDGDNWIVASTNAVGVPSGSVAYFNAQTCPSGWSELTSARGRVLLGMQAGGTLAGSVGTGLDNLATRDITSVPAHSHTVSAPVTSTSNGGAHLHSVDPPSTATSNTEGSHAHSIDPPNTGTSSGGAHSHAILAGPSDDLNFGGGNFDGVSDADSYAHAWRNTNVAGSHAHTVDIAAFSSTSAGAHGHTVDVAAFNSTSAAAHDHTVTIPSFSSASTGSASVDVTMPYLQLLVCQKI